MAELEYSNLGAETPPSVSALEPSLVARVREFCTTWKRTVKTICMYPSSNSLPNEFRQKFYDSLLSLLQEVGTITLTVSDTDLCFNGIPVSQQSSTEDNLAYFLFRDGICRVAFEPGVEFAEASAFLNALAEVYAATEQKPDIANRLWQEALPHIRHYTLDRVIQGSYIEAAGDERLAERHRQFMDSGEPPPKTCEGADSSQGAAPAPYRGIQRERHGFVMEVFGDVAHLSPEEQTALAALSQSGANDADRQVGLEVLFEILRTVEHPRIIEEAIAVTEQQFRGAVQINAWSTVKTILENWRAVATMAPASVSSQIKAAHMRAIDAHFFESLAQYLNASPHCDLSEPRKILENCGPFAVTHITAMLGVLEHRPARLMVCDFLAQNGQDTVDLIGGFVHDKRWYVVRNIAKILGDIGSERGVSFLRKSAAHSDVRVRLETLRALRHIPGSPARQLLVTFLNDADRDIRLQTLRAVGQAGCEAAVPVLAKMIDDRSVTGLEENELRELCTAYARNGGQGAIGRLSRLARRSPWFGRKRWNPVRLAAVQAMAFSSAPEARAELATLARSRNAQIALAAQEAMRRKKTTHGDEDSHKE